VPRGPLTHDLLKQVILAWAAEPRKVIITQVKDKRISPSCTSTAATP